ncbi:uncharacterized protein MELLADRAFT_102702 [Melampsora larici-populina 98AG31]|uniref:Uncharacterized protein n=1 Tax=Melampsora larici-populina (strain 98AG31 / pathotype 3-4-7) TaxID=747676 RepID=F4R942_MELLP|nr:uncharacterized protein MELLADRAFT_102702 [Melampsora larici-populina 98AG31]EGG10919.1 hypothetical protein MELLADRAFT_102702 [Melampsora larici-populina 98AG31]
MKTYPPLSNDVGNQTVNPKEVSTGQASTPQEPSQPKTCTRAGAKAKKGELSVENSEENLGGNKSIKKGGKEKEGEDECEDNNSKEKDNGVNEDTKQITNTKNNQGGGSANQTEGHVGVN